MIAPNEGSIFNSCVAKIKPLTAKNGWIFELIDFTYFYISGDCKNNW